MQQKKLKKIIIFIFLYLLFCTYAFGKTNKYIKIQKDINGDFYLDLCLSNYNNPAYKKSPTLAYLTIPIFNKWVLNNNKNNIATIIKKVGIKKLQKTINNVISKEIFVGDEYFVFYHAHKRELNVFQDIYKKLYEFFNNVFLNNFLFLRLPSSEFDQFNTYQDFCNYYQHWIDNSSYPFNIFDNHTFINNHILSVNPTLFGNSLSSVNKYNSECTFKYFIRSSNITSHNLLNLCNDVFPLFNISDLFWMFQTEIQELIDLLSENETSKVGSLLQIFIPKALVNDIVYRSLPGGVPYYNGVIPREALDLLEVYIDDIVGLRHWKFSWQLFVDEYQDIDELEFRILFTNSILLNPLSGVEIYRYTTKTPNVILYEKKLDFLIKKIIRNTKDDKKIKNQFKSVFKKAASNIAKTLLKIKKIALFGNLMLPSLIKKKFF